GHKVLRAGWRFTRGPDRPIKGRNPERCGKNVVCGADEVRKRTGLIALAWMTTALRPLSGCFFPCHCKSLNESRNPMSGWVPAAHQRLCRFNIAKHHIQCVPDCVKPGTLSPSVLQCDHLTRGGL